MHFLPPSHKEVFEFIRKLESADPTIRIDVIQNTDFYKVELVPKSAVRILRQF